MCVCVYVYIDLLLRVCQANSAKDTVEIAQATVLDGSTNTSHTSLGKGARSVKNAARSVDAYIAKNCVSEVDPYHVELPVKKAGRKHVSGRVVPVLLPHELIFNITVRSPRVSMRFCFGSKARDTSGLTSSGKTLFALHRGWQIILALALCARTTCTACLLACTGTMLPTTRKGRN